jgi:hypothetical protein
VVSSQWQRHGCEHWRVDLPVPKLQGVFVIAFGGLLKLFFDWVVVDDSGFLVRTSLARSVKEILDGFLRHRRHAERTRGRKREEYKEMEAGLRGQPWTVRLNMRFANKRERGISEGNGRMRRIKRNRCSGISDGVDLAMASTCTARMLSRDGARVKNDGGANLASGDAERDHQCGSS